MKHLRLLVTLAVRNVLRNPKRSLLTISAVAIGVGGFVALASLARGLSGNLKEQAIAELTGHVQIHAAGYLDDPAVEHSMSVEAAQLAEFVRRDPEFTLAARRVRLPGVVVSERASRGITLVGIEPDLERGLSFIGDGVSMGRMLSSPEDDGLVIGRKLAENLETNLGKRVVLMSQSARGGIGERGFRIVGIFHARLEATEERFVFLGRRAAQELVGLGEQISEISLKVSDEAQLESNFPQLRSRLVTLFPGLEVKPWMEIQPMVSAVLRVQSGFLYIWLFIVVVTILFGVVNTLFMAIFDRMREIGLLQALGMPPILILKQVLFESVVLLTIGTLAGSAIGLGIARAFSGGIDLSAFSQGLKMAGFGTIIYPKVRGDDLMLANIMALVLGLIASAYPALFAARLRPIEALRKL